ncbi:MAG: hypothetical protein B7Z78_12300 [Rhodospirillales bacterium 20-60-12]|nr:MAG: hypothetical protein B7Z78_12300 [Rhodospirillales bacterium 20-60-12]HQT66884.1 GNAT family N-acetyltransferase [Acetobacteraceae bacterium]HQU00896.1 GNAT family N-acetyltransferase [Acetobacteraceae bacterium]
MSLTAERVRADEADILLAMARDFHLEDGHALTEAGEQAIRLVAAGEPLAPTFFLRQDSEVIGYFVLTLGYSPENGGTDGFIDDIFLRPAWRGQGLGKAALQLAITEARQAGIGVLLLEVEAHNNRAYRLYEQAGFTDTKRRLLRMVL